MNRRYLLPFKTKRLPQIHTDVLVIGGGVAGLRAAAAAAGEAMDVLVVSKHQLSESNTYYAQGGIASVMQADDSFQSHIEDTLTVAINTRSYFLRLAVVSLTDFIFRSCCRCGCVRGMKGSL